MNHTNDRTCVCMYAPTADGGHARYVWELLNALSKHNSPFRYELVTSQDLEEQFKSHGYTINTLLPPLQRRESFANKLSWFASRVAHYTRREWAFLRWLRTRPDIAAVHLQEWTPWLAAPLVRRIRAMGKRVVFTMHNIVPHKYPKWLPKAMVHRWIRNGCRACDGLFVHSEALADELSRFLGPAHPPIRVTPHGVWTIADDAAPPPIEQRLKTKRLLFFGSIRRNKGLDLLLKAAAQLREYSITITGYPLDSEYFATQILPLVKQLKSQGAAIDLQDRFVGEEELPGLFANHSAIVLPYTSGFVAQSGVVFMALAHEIPVIASEAGGLAELMRKFDIGLTFAPATPNALAGAVRKLHGASNAARLAEQIRAAREKYSWASAASATVGGYRATLQQTMETDECAVETTTAS